MTKKKYTEPEINMLEFAEDEIITASATTEIDEITLPVIPAL